MNKFNQNYYKMIIKKLKMIKMIKIIKMITK